MENRAQSRQIWEDAMNSQDFDHKDQRIAELENALRLARPYLAVQLQQLTHVVNDPHVAEARNNLYLIDKALGE